MITLNAGNSGEAGSQNRQIKGIWRKFTEMADHHKKHVEPVKERPKPKPKPEPPKKEPENPLPRRGSSYGRTVEQTQFQTQQQRDEYDKAH